MTLSYNRLLNLTNLTLGYLTSRLTRKVIHRGFPFALSIEPTNCCNLHCPECPSGLKTLTRDRGYIDRDLFVKIIDQLNSSLLYLTFYFQGEPFLHPEFFEMVKYAREKNIFVSTSTNGHFLSDFNAKASIASGLDQLIISLDGIDQESYSLYRKGGSFDKVIEGIRKITALKKELRSKTPKVVLQFLVLKSNQHQVEQVKNLGRELGVDKVSVKSAQFYDFEKGNPLMPDPGRHSRYRKIKLNGDSFLYVLKNKLSRHCLRMWGSCVITWDGWVVPCCFDKDAIYKFGNLNQQSFREIWNADTYREFRQKILSSRKTIEICRNCTEGMGISSIL